MWASIPHLTFAKKTLNYGPLALGWKNQHLAVVISCKTQTFLCQQTCRHTDYGRERKCSRLRWINCSFTGKQPSKKDKGSPHGCVCLWTLFVRERHNKMSQRSSCKGSIQSVKMSHDWLKKKKSAVKIKLWLQVHRQKHLMCCSPVVKQANKYCF